MTILLLALLMRLPGQPESPVAADSAYMHSTWRWDRGGAQAVGIRAGRFYMASGSSVLVISDSTLVSTVSLPGAAQGLVVADTLLYVAAGKAGICVLSIADPDHPGVRATFDLPGYAWSIAVRGSVAAVASGEFGLSFLDVADPLRPSLLATVRAADTVKSVALGAGVALAGAGSQGLLVLDIREPSAPSLSAVVPTPWPAQGVAGRDSIAYVACGDSGVLVLNIARPDQPFRVRSINWPGATAMAVFDTTAVVATGGWGAWLASVRDPSAPVTLCYLPVPGYALGAGIADTMMAVACGPLGVYGYDVSDPVYPQFVARSGQPGYVTGLAVRDSVAWVAMTAGLSAVRFAAGPSDIGGCPLPPVCAGMALGTGFAAVALRDSGVTTIDITNPQTPLRRGTGKVPRPALCVAVRDTTVFAGLVDSSVYAYARSPDGELTTVGSLNRRFSVSGLGVSGGLLAAACGDSGAWLLAAGRPESLGTIARLPGWGNMRGVALDGERCAACGDSGVFLFDVAEPDSPALLSHVPLVATAWDAVYADSLLYVAADWAGVVALDVTDAAQPWSRGYFGGATVCRSVAMADSGVVMGDVFSGLTRLALDPIAVVAEPAVRLAPTTPLISAIAVPPYVRVNVRADERAAMVSLFDASGRRVARAPVGASRFRQTVSFDADPLGAGVFFARVDYGSTSQTVKIQLVR